MQIVDIQEVKKQIESAHPPLKVWLEDIERAPLDAQLRHHVYQLAHQAVTKGDLPGKDFIINELCKILRPHGITKTSINKEFKQYIKENRKSGISAKPLNCHIAADEAKIIDTLTEQFGPPIPLNPFGEAEGINQLFFANKYAMKHSFFMSHLREASMSTKPRRVYGY